MEDKMSGKMSGKIKRHKIVVIFYLQGGNSKQAREALQESLNGLPGDLPDVAIDWYSGNEDIDAENSFFEIL
jgi:hypothetical protein